MDRVYNFSAGPSQMPVEVLEKAQRDMLSYGGSGMSVMEMSHRSQAFQDIIDDAEETLRRLMKIPDSYSVLFLQGGATTQFSMVPMNLAKQTDTAAYAITGHFSQKAMDEAERWCKAVAVSSSKEADHTLIPELKPQDVPEGAAYLHITGNNTIFGTMYKELPEIGSVPLVADWSSAILGTELDVSKHALIYAGAQKNIGPAGLTVVIMKKELLENELPSSIPIMLRYKIQADKGSMYNTPPCWAIYISGLMFKWVEAQGGVAEMAKRNKEKSGLLYDFIDNSSFYSNSVRAKDRSTMNAVFELPTAELTREFAAFAAGKGLLSLAGHKARGGCRASLYNAMPLEGVKKLIEIMKEFEYKNV